MRSATRTLFAAMLVAAMAFRGSAPCQAAPPKIKLSKPTIGCAIPLQTALRISVCAGTTGAPYGFSLQWMTQADFLNGTAYNLPGQWPANSDVAAFSGVLCKASFSGNANLSRYNLGMNQCVTPSVEVGDFLFDNGTSTNCATELRCGTSYVFRAFAHGGSACDRSDFTPTLICSTLPCGASGVGCTLTQGFWKTHGPAGCVTGNNTNVWPVNSLTLGAVAYTDLQLCSILNTPAGGNGLIALAHQLIAAKLNIASGADGSAVTGAIAAAEALIGVLVVPPVGSGFLSPSVTSALTTTLDDYNNGRTGPGHCP